MSVGLGPGDIVFDGDQAPGMLSPRKGLGLEARKPDLGLGLVTAGLGLGLGLVGVLASASCNLASRPRQ